MISAPNNLPAPSQAWAQQVQREIDASQKALLALSATVSTLTRTQSRLFRSSGNLNVKVVPIEFWTSSSEFTGNLFMSVETPVDENYDLMILNVQISAHEYFTSSGSDRKTRVYGGWNYDTLPIAGQAANVVIIPAGADSAFPTVSVSAVFRTSDFTAGGPTPYVYGGTETSSAVSGYTAEQCRITGSVIYFKEQS